MFDYKSAISNLSNSICAFTKELQQGNWSSTFHALYKKLLEIDYKSKASQIYSLISELLSGARKEGQSHLKKPRGSRQVKSSLSTLRVAAHQSKEPAPELTGLDSRTGVEALALAHERYARENHTQFFERRRVLDAQCAELSEQLQQLEEKQQELHAMLADIFAQQAEMDALDRNSRPIHNPHSNNNLYG